MTATATTAEVPNTTTTADAQAPPAEPDPVEPHKEQRGQRWVPGDVGGPRPGLARTGSAR